MRSDGGWMGVAKNAERMRSGVSVASIIAKQLHQGRHQFARVSVLGRKTIGGRFLAARPRRCEGRGKKVKTGTTIANNSKAVSDEGMGTLKAL